MCLATHRLSTGHPRGNFRRLGVRRHSRMSGALPSSSEVPGLPFGGLHPGAGPLPDARDPESELRRTPGGTSPERGRRRHASCFGARGQF